METKIKLVIYIRANTAESGPPLGTTLGNIGVNALKFCKEFNEFTKDLPNYFLLKVSILVTETRSFTFTVEMPPIGSLIYLLKKEDSFKDSSGIIHTYNYIDLEDLLKLAKFKFPLYDLRKSTAIIKGTLYSSNISIKE